jgi:hypothetical protein
MLWRTLEYERRRERVRIGTEDRQGEAPDMDTGKRRGRGDGMGAEDGDVWAETVRSDAVN